MLLGLPFIAELLILLVKYRFVIVALVAVLLPAPAWSLALQHQLDLNSRRYVDVTTQISELQASRLVLQTLDTPCDMQASPSISGLSVQLADATPLSWQRLGNGELSIAVEPGVDAIELRYRLHFSHDDWRNQIEADRAIIDPATWLWHAADASEQQLVLRLPNDWPIELIPLSRGNDERWSLAEPQQLANSPMVFGQFLRLPIIDADARVEWLIPRNPLWRADASLDSLRRLFRHIVAASDLQGNYTLITLLNGDAPSQPWPEAGLQSIPAWSQRDDNAYWGWFGELASTFWYSQLPGFGQAEMRLGLADYLGVLSLPRAGLIEHRRFLQRLANQLTTHRGESLGRACQASRGSITPALQLDAWLRQSTRQASSLPMETWLRQAREDGRTIDFASLQQALPSREQALSHFGLQAVAYAANPPAWLGSSLVIENGRLWLRGTIDGEENPLRNGDELLALDGYRVTEHTLQQRLAAYQAKDSVTVLIARHGAIEQHRLELPARPSHRWRLQPLQDAEAEQRLNLWLDGTSP
jgi:predicted metalloprotease with PDZ domain